MPLAFQLQVAEKFQRNSSSPFFFFFFSFFFVCVCARTLNTIFIKKKERKGLYSIPLEPREEGSPHYN